MDTILILGLIALCIGFAVGYLLRGQNNYESGQDDGIEKGRKIYTGQIVRIDQLAEMLKEDLTVKIISIYKNITETAAGTDPEITEIVEVEILKVGPRSLEKEREAIIEEFITSGKRDFVDALQLAIDTRQVKRFADISKWFRPNLEINQILTIRPAKDFNGLTSIIFDNPYPD